MGLFDVALKVKFKHGRLYQYMIDNNLNLDQMSYLLKISKATLAKILNFRWCPKREYQTLKVAKKLETFFGCDIEEIFPRELSEKIKNDQEIRKTLQDTHVFHKEIEIEYLPFYSIPQISYTPDFDDFDIKEKIKDALKNLKPREEKIIRMKFGIEEEEHTYEEIGKEFDITRERVRQIEAKALQNLKHPLVKNGLKDFVSA